MKISPSPSQTIAPSNCGMGGTPEGVYFPNSTRPLCIQLYAASLPIARKMLSKG
ncbi:hypothetical protein QT970_16920 [Microcoleus sp. herbarium8]|uniref:hypothetical protein n=1 Tax=Microcoleus sp. herbarium8 TaxID=3055436 RepID=UPI002FD5EAC0